MSYKRINVCETHPEDKSPSAISVHILGYYIVKGNFIVCAIGESFIVLILHIDYIMVERHPTLA